MHNEDRPEQRPVCTEVSDDQAKENYEDGGVDLASPPKYFRDCRRDTLGDIQMLDLGMNDVHA